MEPKLALQYLSPARVSLALSTIVDRLGIAEIPFTNVLHTLVEEANKGVLPTYASVLQSFSEVTFTPDNVTNLPLFADPEQLSHVATVAELLEAIVNECVISVHDLSCALEMLSPTVERSWPHYQPNSLLDLLVRKTYVAYSSLDFDGLTTLRDLLEKYVKKDVATSSSSTEPPHNTLPSPFPDDIARAAVAALSSPAPAKSSHYGLLTELHETSVRQSTDAISISPSTLAHVEYALHLECTRRRDSTAATALLHRAFDLSLGARVDLPSGAAPRPIPSQLLPRRVRTQSAVEPIAVPNERAQYGALALAQLSAHSGQFISASRALDDCVRIAQHNGDDWCQARALGWLTHTARSTKRRRELLRRTEDGLALAEDELHAPCTRRQGSALTSSAARMRSIAARVGAATGDMRPDALLVSAAAWMGYAATPTALRVAKAALSAARTERHGVPTPMSGSEARALCAVASIVAVEESPRRAVAMLDNALRDAIVPDHATEFATNTSSTFPEMDTLRRTRIWIAFRRAIVRRELVEARQLLADIEAFAVCAAGAGGSPSAAAEMRLDALEARVRLNLAQGEFGDACKTARELREAAAAWSLPERAVEGALLCARAHLGSGSGSAALPLAVGAVALCAKLGLCSAHVKSSLMLAEAMISIQGATDGVSESEKVLIGVLPQAVGGMGKWVRGYARRLFAVVMLSKMRVDEGDSVKYNEIAKALADGVKAYEDAEDIEGVRECLFLLAKVLDAQGDIEQRDLMARKFRLNVECIQRREMEAQ